MDLFQECRVAKTILKRHLAVAAGLLSSALCVAAIACVAMAADSFSRHISYRFTLRNTTGSAILQAELWTCAPHLLTANQERISLSAWHPFDLQTDVTGNQILHFAFSDFPPYGTKIVTIEADLLFTEYPRFENSGDPFIQ